MEVSSDHRPVPPLLHAGYSVILDGICKDRDPLGDAGRMGLHNRRVVTEDLGFAMGNRLFILAYAI